MTNGIRAGRVLGVPVFLERGFFIGFVLFSAAFAWFGATTLGLPPGEAIVGGLAAETLLWLSEFLHNVGHAIAARRTGWPMIGISLGLMLALGRSIYPADEPALPSGVHVRRALGGPLVSLLIAALLLPVALALRPTGGAPFYVAAFGAGLNFFVYTLQALVPLGFNDGAVIWRAVRERFRT